MSKAFHPQCSLRLVTTKKNDVVVPSPCLYRATLLFIKEEFLWLFCLPIHNREKHSNKETK